MIVVVKKFSGGTILGQKTSLLGKKLRKNVIFQILTSKHYNLM